MELSGRGTRSPAYKREVVLSISFGERSPRVSGTGIVVKHPSRPTWEHLDAASLFAHKFFADIRGDSCIANPSYSTSVLGVLSFEH